MRLLALRAAVLAMRRSLLRRDYVVVDGQVAHTITWCHDVIPLEHVIRGPWRVGLRVDFLPRD